MAKDGVDAEAKDYEALLAKAEGILYKILIGLEHGHIKDTTLIDHGSNKMTTLKEIITNFLVDELGYVNKTDAEAA